jgi:hypothetical protein
MYQYMRCDGKSWKFFVFWSELNKAEGYWSFWRLKSCKMWKCCFRCLRKAMLGRSVLSLFLAVAMTIMSQKLVLLQRVLNFSRHRLVLCRPNHMSGRIRFGSGRKKVSCQNLYLLYYLKRRPSICGFQNSNLRSQSQCSYSLKCEDLPTKLRGTFDYI